VSETEASNDATWLDAQLWIVAACARCNHPRVPTMTVGHIEGNSGPGYEIRFCRACVELLLAAARAGQADGRRPRLPAALAEAVSMESLMRQAAEHQVPPPDPAELAQDKAKLMAYADGRDVEAEPPTE
jgi:hypothetical protein